MSSAVYALCAATSTVCAVLLLRAWARDQVRLLLWSGVCFAGLTVNNLLLVIDLAVVEHRDLSVARGATALASVSVLLLGLVWESR